MTLQQVLRRVFVNEKRPMSQVRTIVDVGVARFERAWRGSAPGGVGSLSSNVYGMGTLVFSGYDRSNGRRGIIRNGSNVQVTNRKFVS